MAGQGYTFLRPDPRPFRIRCDEYPKFIAALQVLSTKQWRDTKELVNRSKPNRILHLPADYREKACLGTQEASA